MRIIHVAPTAFGASGLFGGGERYPLELARAQAAHADVELVTFGPPGRRVDPTGLRVRSLHPLRYGGGHPAQPLNPQVVAAVSGADVVHTHQTRSAPSRLAALAARARGQALVTTDHGLGGGGWGGLLPRLFDRFLPVSACSAQLLGTPPERTTVIYGGTDPERFHPDPAVSRHGVLFVGRLTPHKGVDVLLRALPPGAPLTVVGTGGHDPRPPERDYPQLLRRLAAESDVRFVGAVPDAELPALYRGAAVVVLPTVQRTCYGRDVAITELLGLSLLEAMASGTPVVASRVGGLPEVVRHGETGYLVTPGDEGELRERLAELLGSPQAATRMGERARDLVLERFTWSATAQRCLTAYAEVLAARSGPA